MEIPQYLDHGYYLISQNLASRLAKAVDKPLPKPGRELCVDCHGVLVWLTRTMHQGKQHWALYSYDRLIGRKGY